MVRKISQWFLTYPQCAAAPDGLLKHLQVLDNIVHYVIACEKHQDGNNHLHAYVKYTDGVLAKDAPISFDFDGFHGNYQPARSCKSVVKYCTKGDDYISNFDIQQYLAKKGKLTADVIKAKTTAQALTDGDISFMHVRHYREARAVLVEPFEYHTTRGIWIWGQTGVGKSRIVREHASLVGYRLFSKSQNKWFDGYDGEEIIMIDDFDLRGDCLDHYLKIWTDRYACSGEVKGSTVQLRHYEFIVTSNFPIAELFKDVPEVTLNAILRRFRVVYMSSYESVDPRTLAVRENRAIVMPKPLEVPRPRSRSPIDRMSFTEANVYGNAVTLRPVNKKY